MSTKKLPCASKGTRATQTHAEKTELSYPKMGHKSTGYC